MKPWRTQLAAYLLRGAPVAPPAESPELVALRAALAAAVADVARVTAERDRLQAFADHRESVALNAPAARGTLFGFAPVTGRA